MKVVSRRFQQSLGSFTMSLVKESCETGPFRLLLEEIFCSPQFRKYVSCEGHLSFQNVQNLINMCSGIFTMLLVEGSCETRLFRHESQHVFRSPQFRNK